ncbi:MAG: ABC transporter permease [Vicinamibacteria bacterium]
MNGIRQDVAYAFRQIRRQPGFALIIVLTLGSTMGISTALFSMADLSWSRIWPVPNPERIVTVPVSMSLEELHLWAEHARSFDGVAGVALGFRFADQRNGGRQTLYQYVTPNYFDVLRVKIALGRMFTDTDDRFSGSEPEIVISDQSWAELFGRDPNVIGTRIPFGRSKLTIVGVVAPGFNGAGSIIRFPFWTSLAARAALDPRPVVAQTKNDSDPRQEVFAVGRLAEGVTAKQAEAELNPLRQQFRASLGLKPVSLTLETPETYAQTSASPRARATVLTWTLAIAFLTMIACANVSNLMLARGHARRGEIAVRLSLGATRGRLLRQFLVEAFVLSLAAGLVGIAFASFLPSHVFSSVPDFAQMMQIGFRLDTRIFVWTLMLSTLACIVFGLSPALKVTGLKANEVLKDSNGQAAPALRTSLSSVQAFVSVMALGIAGLVLRSDTYVQTQQLARRMESLVMVRPTFPEGYDPTRVAQAQQRLLDALVTGFGSKNIAAARNEPVAQEPGQRITLDVSAGYFGVMGLPFTAGRTFTTNDTNDGVVILSETLAKTLWPGESAIGHTLPLTNSTSAPLEVIGVVRDRSIGEAASYRPILAKDMNLFFVRDSERHFRQRAPSIAASVDAGLQLDATPGSLWLSRTSPGAALSSRVFGEFGAFALALTAMGIFSLSEYLVRQRTREIGIRTALGARPRHILMAILKPATGSLGSGLAAGTVGAIVSGFLMRHWGLPAGVRPLDLMNYVTVGLLITIVGLVAMWRPAVKAIRVEPNVALRYE